MTFVSRLKKIAKECGQILLRATDIEEGIITKAGKANYVTAYDFTIQESLRKSLTDILPSAGFMGEEDPDETQIFSEYVFIVDPIDGTTNFMRDAKASCISIALTFHGNPVVGVVYNPYLEECFWAVEGKGAFLNDKKITVSDKLLQDCLIYFGTSPYEVEWSQKSFSIAYEYFQHAADIRRSGSAALDLCAVACGRGDFFFELCLQPWDYAAASLIVTQAGGVMSDLWGTPITYDRKQIVVARAKNVELLPLSRF
ncbi:MAG: inositol monophosphatase [Lachnospiraceae bacterium]|nr:inositol monophosphatase [Lachnospiraceae bacterium]